MITASPAALSILLFAGMAQAKDTTRAGEPVVTVCLESTADLSHFRAAARSQQIVSRMFADIGVRIVWRHLGFDSCPVQAIRISVTDQTPTKLRPGALAFAMPYEGSYVRVFYDRIAYSGPVPLIPHLLAHVMAHEIAHLLQGTSRHSETGVMKAQWDQFDLSQMPSKPLPFTQWDIDLIHSGLAGMSVRPASGKGTDSGAVLVPVP